MLSLYPVIKLGHMVLAISSIVLFVLRSVRYLRGGTSVIWSKHLPRTVDSVLLLSAIGLMLLSGQYPGWVNWLTLKLLLLSGYILLGMTTLYWAKQRPAQLAAFALACCCFLGILFLAVHKPLL